MKMFYLVAVGCDWGDTKLLYLGPSQVYGIDISGLRPGVHGLAVEFLVSTLLDLSSAW